MLRYLPLILIGMLAFSSCSNKLATVENPQESYGIIPKPETLQAKKGLFQLNNSTKVQAEKSLAKESSYLATILSNETGVSISTAEAGNIVLKVDENIKAEEGYKLIVQHEKIEIIGSTAKGVFYGIQTLRQLISQEERDGVKQWVAPAVVIEDAPRFAYRGMHLDVARHFYSVDFVKRYLDIMALHKMNTFHWHLTEDQGWRIEIKKYPKLTEVGAWRNGTIEGRYPGTKNTNQKYGGFYTQDQIKDVVAYAASLHITVIPEIELPGHSSAAIAAYPFLSCFPKEKTIVPKGMMSEASKLQQKNGTPKVVQESWGIYDDVYCAGNEETFAFLEDVLLEVMDLFPSKYIHIGGDECPKANWEKCKNCQKRIKDLGIVNEHELQSYFITRMEKFVNSKGRNIIGWDEILEGGLAPNATVMSWRGNKGGIAAAKAKHDVIMSPNSHCYFDHYQAKDKDNEPLAIGGFLPLEKVYAFDPVPADLKADEQKYILGGQANLWTEYISSEKQAEYMLLPRLTALSEALWTQKSEKNWSNFEQRLLNFSKRYDALGLNYAKHFLKTPKKIDK